MTEIGPELDQEGLCARYVSVLSRTLYDMVGSTHKVICHNQDTPPSALVRTLKADLVKWYIASPFATFLLYIFEGY